MRQKNEVFGKNLLKNILALALLVPGILVNYAPSSHAYSEASSEASSESGFTSGGRRRGRRRYQQLQMQQQRMAMRQQRRAQNAQLRQGRHRKQTDPHMVIKDYGAK